MVKRKNAELADLAYTAAGEADRLLAKVKRAIRKAKLTRPAAARVEGLIRCGRGRAAGSTDPCRGGRDRPGPVWHHHARRTGPDGCGDLPQLLVPPVSGHRPLHG